MVTLFGLAANLVSCFGGAVVAKPSLEPTAAKRSRRLGHVVQLHAFSGQGAASEVQRVRQDLVAALPAGGAVASELDDFTELLSKTARFLSIQPPAPPAERIGGLRGETEAQARRRVEAYFERELQFEEGHRVHGAELVGELVAPVERVQHVVLPVALAAMVLEDMSALGYDAPGSAFAQTPEESALMLPVSMAHTHVLYSGLAAEAYRHCARAAEQRSADAWVSHCEAGARRMLLFSQRLPDCTHPDVLSPPGDPIPEDVTATQAGLILHGAYGVPLLDAEISQVHAAVQVALSKRVDLPLLPIQNRPEHDERAGPSGSESHGGCMRASRASARLFADNPNTRWYGLSLACPEPGGSCAIAVCGDGEASCLRADLDPGQHGVERWLQAVASLEPSHDALLVESTGSVEATDYSRVSIADVVGFGAWGEQDDSTQTLLAASERLLTCQGKQRYAGQWTLRIARSGRVVGLRGLDEGLEFPMDHVSRADSSDAGNPEGCIFAALKELRFSRARSAAHRRLMFRLAIPAQVQVQLPLALRHDGTLERMSAPRTLSQDGIAMAIARCAGMRTPAPRQLGVCMAIESSGNVGDLSVDVAPDRLPRVALRHRAQPINDSDLYDVKKCLGDVISQFSWGCAGRKDTSHVAFTLTLPRGLLGR